MGNHHHQEGTIIKSFSLTAIASFAIVFCLFTLFSNCHGKYQPPTEGHGTAKHDTHQKHDAKPNESKPENHTPTSTNH